jgi:hypothetical protein
VRLSWECEEGRKDGSGFFLLMVCWGMDMNSTLLILGIYTGYIACSEKRDNDDSPLRLPSLNIHVGIAGRLDSTNWFHTRYAMNSTTSTHFLLCFVFRSQVVSSLGV